jgi:hypothetical protein
LKECKAKNREQRGLVRIPRDEEEVKVKHYKTIKSSNNNQRASTTRLKNEHGNIKVQTWENAGPRIKNKEL